MATCVNNPFPQETSFLRFIGETTISAIKAGSGMDQDNKQLFSWTDACFKEWDTQWAWKDTKKVKAIVYEQIQSGNYAQIFRSLKIGFDFIKFKTALQIKDFVKKSPELLDPKGLNTHFLFENESGECYVASVRCRTNGDLTIYTYGFWGGAVSPDYLVSRFVILAPQNLKS